MAATDASTTKASVLLEFDSGVKPRAAPKGYDKPWRKPADAVRAERERTRQLLGGSEKGGVDLGAVHHVLAVRECLEAESGTGAKHDQIQSAATLLLQVATNARDRAEIDAARTALDEAVAQAGLNGTVAKWLQRSITANGGSSAALKKLQLMHEVTRSTGAP